MSLKLTRMIERRIVSKIIRDAITAGYTITVSYDEGEDPVVPSTDRTAILKAMWACDEEWLYLHRAGSKERFAWVRLIYGNGNNGCDVVCDYATSLEPIMEPVQKLAEQLEEKWA